MLGAGALLAISVSVLAACGSVADQASQTLPVNAKTGAPGSPLALSTPSMISQAIASGTQAGATPKPTGSKAAAKAKLKKSASGSASSSASAPAAGSTSGATPGAPAASPSSPGTAGQSASDPSGADPATSLSGFSLKYVQDFSGSSMPSSWDSYTGNVSGYSSSVAQWSPSMCSFSGGEAHLSSAGINSCGLEFYGGDQQYGAWFARFKGDSQASNLFYSNIFLLWPANNSWPPEIDIYEDLGNRAETRATLINTASSCGSSGSLDCLAPYEQTNGTSNGTANDGTAWHTYGVEWTPSGVTWLIDGQVIFTAPASGVKSGAAQPALPMRMALQTENLQGSGSPSQLEDMTVDWVEEFSYNG